MTEVSKTEGCRRQNLFTDQSTFWTPSLAAGLQTRPDLHPRALNPALANTRQDNSADHRSPRSPGGKADDLVAGGLTAGLSWFRMT